MPIFLVLPTRGRKEIVEHAKATGIDILDEPFKEGGFLASFAGTPVELGRAIGISEENTLGEGIVLPFAGHHGYANTQIWSWIKSRKERENA
ncbi:hypothetical protein [Pseudomonas sp. G1002]|uniref:hypothetical protein n=1 Tax=Pseudomonas sp. G1002 TaxID=410942 RepID=UPI0015A27BD7|nr:hypothetical protein [Pseudomonas sp. G1002]NWC07225.1 hypothetical protein [Pseudomonas sp. G1002]